MKRHWVAAILSAIVAAGVSAPATASAQEIELTGPLKGAPATRKLREYRLLRVELAPTVSYSLLDQYRHTILIGGRLGFGITDWLTVGVWGGFNAYGPYTTLTNEIASIYDNTPPPAQANTNLNPNGFKNQVAKINWVAAPQVTFTPFRGKMAFFNSLFVDADFYVSGGVGFVGMHERAYCGPGTGGYDSCTNPDSFNTVSRMAIAPTAALGLDFYATNYFSVGLEYRALPFKWNPAGFDTRGAGTNSNFPDGKVNASDDQLQINQMLTLSFTFFLPAKPTISE